MNVFVMIMLVFAALGLVDKILGGKLGFAPDLRLTPSPIRIQRFFTR